MAGLGKCKQVPKTEGFVTFQVSQDLLVRLFLNVVPDFSEKVLDAFVKHGHADLRKNGKCISRTSPGD